jgi:hypothetical protein
LLDVRGPAAAGSKCKVEGVDDDREEKWKTVEQNGGDECRRRSGGVRKTHC